MLGPGKASGGEGPSSLSGQESAYMTFKHDENGELHARDVSFIDVDGWKIAKS